MAHRLKQKVEVIAISGEPLTIVTKSRVDRGGRLIPLEFMTGYPGMSLVIITRPGGYQHRYFMTPGQVAEELEAEEDGSVATHLHFQLPAAAPATQPQPYTYPTAATK